MLAIFIKLGKKFPLPPDLEFLCSLPLLLPGELLPLELLGDREDAFLGLELVRLLKLLLYGELLVELVVSMLCGDSEFGDNDKLRFLFDGDSFPVVTVLLAFNMPFSWELNRLKKEFIILIFSYDFFTNKLHAQITNKILG